jgi:hypothetical protein
MELFQDLAVQVFDLAHERRFEKVDVDHCGRREPVTVS